jgi:hypothetical protein
MELTATVWKGNFRAECSLPEACPDVLNAGIQYLRPADQAKNVVAEFVRIDRGNRVGVSKDLTNSQ